MLFTKRVVRATAFMFVAFGYLVLSSPLLSHADTNQSLDWKSGVPTITKVADSGDSSDSSNLNLDCTNMTMSVMRNVANILLPNNEQHCMIATGAGLIDNQATIVQPSGYSKAYPLINSSRGGHPSLIAVPGTLYGLLIASDVSYPGTNIGVYQNVWSHFHFNDNAISPAFTLIDDADSYIKYDGGRLMAFNTAGTLSFSRDGTSLLADSSFQGFVKINLATLSYTTIAPGLFMVNGTGLLNASTSLNSDGSYAAIAYSAPGGYATKYFKIIDVKSCGMTTAAYNAGNSTCKTVDLINTVSTFIPNLKSVGKLRFIQDGAVLFTANYGEGNTTSQAQFTMTAAGQSASREQYLAMGDSYISGEGAYAYREGTDTSNNRCHQSINSYPYLLGATFDSFASVACSGAVIFNFNGTGAKDNVDQLQNETVPTTGEQTNAISYHIPGVISQATFINQDNPQAVTISIGGNDVGFGDIIQRCIMPFNSLTSTAQNCYQTYEDRLELVNTINGQFNNLYQTYLQLKAGSPTRRVYVIGYPQIVKPDGDCGLNVRLSQPDTEFAAQLVSYLDSVIAQAAAKAGVQYVSTEHAFDGHRLCEGSRGDVAVNGLTAGTDKLGIIGTESYHPNQLGHQLLATTIKAATSNLTKAMPVAQMNTPNPTASDSLPILASALKVNRTLYNVLNAGQDILQVSPGTLTPFSLAGLSGLKPSSLFDAVLHSDPVNVGTAQVDAAGNLNLNMMIPASVPPGFHTLHLYGKNLAGEPIDIQKTVYVSASSTDSDGDGIANAVDQCQYLPSTGADVDQDGIDDACDPNIGPTPAAPPSSAADPATTAQSGTSDQSGQRTITVTDASDVTIFQPAASPTFTMAVRNINTILPIEIDSPSSYRSITVLGAVTEQPSLNVTTSATKPAGAVAAAKISTVSPTFSVAWLVPELLALSLIPLLLLRRAGL